MTAGSGASSSLADSAPSTGADPTSDSGLVTGIEFDADPRPFLRDAEADGVVREGLSIQNSKFKI